MLSPVTRHAISATHPLLVGPNPDTGAERSVCIWHGRAITSRQLLGDILALAATLPAAQHVVNVCQDRYAFIVGFGAALVRGQISLLPPTRVPGVIAAIVADYADAYLLADADVPSDLPCHRIGLDRLTNTATSAAVPAIDMERIAALVFTSGSTGKATANPKTWRMLVHGACINAVSLLRPSSVSPAVVATVPSQHMYGFETTVMLPLLGHCVIDCSRPLYPQDVRHSLEKIAAPRILITTPVHLRALAESVDRLPELEAIWSATAPLSTNLAAKCEAQYGAVVQEIYGCTESGIVATRRTSSDEPWRLMEPFSLAVQDDGAVLAAEHLPHSVRLLDLIDAVDARRFRLRGRSSDLVNIAGKRASLGDLNAKLLAIDGVHDGVIFLPAGDDDESAGHVRRTAALVVAPGQAPESILQKLRLSIDPAFVPRPLLLVDALPRSDTGKLPREAILRLYEQINTRQHG